MRMRFGAPSWGSIHPIGLAFVMAFVCAAVAPAAAQPKHKADKNDKAAAPAVVGDPKDAKGDPRGDPKGEKKAGKQGPTKTYDFNALDLNGRMRTPQLLYFLERANEELERASLEKRSFIPHMVRSMEEEAL
jgi:hypothetical protein